MVPSLVPISVQDLSMILSLLGFGRAREVFLTDSAGPGGIMSSYVGFPHQGPDSCYDFGLGRMLIDC